MELTADEAFFEALVEAPDRALDTLLETEEAKLDRPDDNATSVLDVVLNPVPDVPIVKVVPEAAVVVVVDAARVVATRAERARVNFIVVVGAVSARLCEWWFENDRRAEGYGSQQRINVKQDERTMEDYLL